jgi:hypothetical protein
MAGIGNNAQTTCGRPDSLGALLTFSRPSDRTVYTR